MWFILDIWQYVDIVGTEPWNIHKRHFTQLVWEGYLIKLIFSFLCRIVQEMRVIFQVVLIAMMKWICYGSSRNRNRLITQMRWLSRLPRRWERNYTHIWVQISEERNLIPWWVLTHWGVKQNGHNDTKDIFKYIFWKENYCILKKIEFHWSLSLRVHLTVSQHWFR